MSILDFAENPQYQLVAVALSPNDVAVIFNTKREKLRPVLEMAIAALEAELVKLPPSNGAGLTKDKRARKENPREPASPAS